MHITSFTFNLYAENTYVVWDDTKDCIIIDPGCFEDHEEQTLKSFIERSKLKPVKLINTHCHIDHVLGNKFVSETWKLDLEMHEADLTTLQRAFEYGPSIGLPMKQSPKPEVFLKEGDHIVFGNTELKVLFTPGHAPGHISLLNESTNEAIVGDVLFLNSIGRTDLPGGNYDMLITSIREKLLVLDDDVKVYPGHGPSTTIGFERRSNPFVGENGNYKQEMGNEEV